MSSNLAQRRMKPFFKRLQNEVLKAIQLGLEDIILSGVRTLR